MRVEIKILKLFFDTRTRDDTHSGFTLIELLVVIAVIAVLLAILIPSLSKVRVIAKRTGCSSNLKQLIIAWKIYLDDHEGRFYQGPRANYDYGGWKGIKGWWPRPLNSYVGLSDPNRVTERSGKVFCCPSDRGGIPGAFLRDKAYLVHGTSYQTNIFLIGQEKCGSFSRKTESLDQEISKRLTNLNRNDVANSSLLFLMGDHGWINQWNPEPFPNQEWKNLAEWHGKANCHNMAFLDGHVKFVNILKGYYVTEEYRVLPFEDLDELAKKVQGP